MKSSQHPKRLQMSKHLTQGIHKRGTRSLKVVASIATGAWCLALLLAPLAARAQNYAIDWYKVAGGGGTSTGGLFAVNGTLGQHDAGPAMSGGNYSLAGGFWVLYAVQTPGAPLLKIFRTSTNT